MIHSLPIMVLIRKKKHPSKLAAIDTITSTHTTHFLAPSPITHHPSDKKIIHSHY